MEITRLFKLLSDQTRINIILALQESSHCVCELQEILNEDQPKISKHLKKMRDAGLVSTKKRDNFIYYSLVDSELLTLIVNYLNKNL